MKKIVLITICLITLQSFVVKAQQPILLTVTVKGLKSTKGTLRIQLVDEQNKDAFTKTAVLTDKTFTIGINVYVKGKYAINVFHDKNNNGKLDTNLIGIPKEGWGCSNDARGVMGAPKFKDKLFSVTANKNIIINLVHY